MKIYNEHGEEIRACNKNGERIPVIHTLQAHLEWSQEYKRAERYKLISIAELVVIGALLIWKL